MVVIECASWVFSPTQLVWIRWLGIVSWDYITYYFSITDWKSITRLCCKFDGMFYYGEYSVHYKQNTAMVDPIRCHQNKQIDNSLTEKTEIIKSACYLDSWNLLYGEQKLKKTQNLCIIVMLYYAIFMSYYSNISYILWLCLTLRIHAGLCCMIITMRITILYLFNHTLDLHFYYTVQ
mgnify:CR=1 FL=1